MQIRKLGKVHKIAFIKRQIRDVMSRALAWQILRGRLGQRKLAEAVFDDGLPTETTLK